MDKWERVKELMGSIQAAVTDLPQLGATPALRAELTAKRSQVFALLGEVGDVLAGQEDKKAAKKEAPPAEADLPKNVPNTGKRP